MSVTWLMSMAMGMGHGMWHVAYAHGHAIWGMAMPWVFFNWYWVGEGGQAQEYPLPSTNHCQIPKAKAQKPSLDCQEFTVSKYQARGIQSIFCLGSPGKRLDRNQIPGTESDEYCYIHMELFMGKNVDHTHLFGRAIYQEGEINSPENQERDVRHRGSVIVCTTPESACAGKVPRPGAQPHNTIKSQPATCTCDFSFACCTLYHWATCNAPHVSDLPSQAKAQEVECTL